jgi:hypothetical protein
LVELSGFSPPHVGATPLAARADILREQLDGHTGAAAGQQGESIPRRDQPEHAIRTACQTIHQSEVIVVGSQAILGTYDESQLPRPQRCLSMPMAETTMRPRDWPT